MDERTEALQNLHKAQEAFLRVSGWYQVPSDMREGPIYWMKDGELLQSQQDAVRKELRLAVSAGFPSKDAEANMASFHAVTRITGTASIVAACLSERLRREHCDD